MDQYRQLITNKKIINDAIKRERHSVHKSFYSNNRKAFMLLDILAVCIILVNYGALFTTHALVIQKNPEIQLYEANPAAAKTHGFEDGSNIEGEAGEAVKEKGVNVFKSFLIVSLYWSCLIFIYLFVRNRSISETDLYMMLFVILVYAVSLSIDFVNNLGYFVGTVIWAV